MLWWTVGDFAFHSLDFGRDLVDALLDRFNVRMHLAENVVLFLRDLFDAARLFGQFLQNGVLPLGDTVHPPEANTPAAQISQVKKIQKGVAHFTGVSP